MTLLKKSKGECEICEAKDVDLITFADLGWQCNYCWVSYEAKRPFDPASWKSVARAFNILEKRLSKK